MSPIQAIQAQAAIQKKQTITTRADKRTLTATPGIVSRVPCRVGMVTNTGLTAIGMASPVVAAHIVDECHHISAFSLEAILKQAKAKYVMGLTATPVRRDGHQLIIFMQCGPIRHSAARSKTAPAQLEVWPKEFPAPEIPPSSPNQDVFRILANDTDRNQRIAQDVLAAYSAGRKVLVLTERTDHLVKLREALGEELESRLDALDSATCPEDMNVVPGWRFHEWSGKDKGTYSVDVSGNWRITFTFKDGDAYVVNYEDPH